RIDDLAALDDVGMQPLAPQVEEAIFEPDVLGILLLAEHRHRQFGGLAQHLDVADEDLDRAGRQVWVVGAAGPPPHLAVERPDPWAAQLLGWLEGRTVGVGDTLRDAVMVAQVDEQGPAMITDAVAPAGQPRLLPDIAIAKRAAGLSAVAVHESIRT